MIEYNCREEEEVDEAGESEPSENEEDDVSEEGHANLRAPEEVEWVHV